MYKKENEISNINVKQWFDEWMDKVERLEVDEEAYQLLSNLIIAFCYSKDGMYIVDYNGTTLMANPAFEELSGNKLNDLIGRNVKDLVNEGYFSPSIAEEVLKTKKRQNLVQLNRNGKVTLVTGSPIFNEEGEVEKVVSNIRDITELAHLSDELATKKKLLENQARIVDKEDEIIKGIVAESDGMKKITNLARKIAKTDKTVLITGESGSGKGVIAKLIYGLSERNEKPFISLNCSAIPAQLLESEIFGYAQGAFTGAERGGKIGLAEAANGGVLFLDEIAEMPLSMQPKMLSFLETGEITPVGTTKTKKLDVRIIAATNRDLNKMTESGTFRSDLYYRLNVLPIWIPPLRERPEDIIPLIMKATMKYNETNNSNKRFTHSAYETMVRYPWPGNVRELFNLMDRIFILCENDEIGVEDLPLELRQSYKAKDHSFDDEAQWSINMDPSLPISMPRVMDNLEKKLIDKAMKEGGSIRNAAKLLGITPSSLYRRISK